MCCIRADWQIQWAALWAVVAAARSRSTTTRVVNMLPDFLAAPVMAMVAALLVYKGRDMQVDEEACPTVNYRTTTQGCGV